MAKGANNSSKFPINTQPFSGGVTIDPKLGIPNSFYYSQNLDFRSKPSQISVLPAPRQLVAGLNDTILAMEQDLSGARWGVGSLGSIYRIDNSNNVSVVGKLTENGSAGLLYNQITDQLYIPGQSAVSMYGQVTTGNVGQPQLRLNNFAQSSSVDPGCANLFNDVDNFFDGVARNSAETQTDDNGNLLNATYKLLTTLSEQPGDFCFFAPDIEPFYSIQVWPVNKGTGDWTLTLHDSQNNKLASVTVANANLTNGKMNEFKFSSQIRALVNASQTGNSATYHFHLTSTVADGTVLVVNAGDLSSADFLLFAYRLVETNNKWHPTALFTGSGKPLLCIGNGEYLSTYDFSDDSVPTNFQWQRHALQFKHGYEVCGLSNNNQYLVIAVERRSTNTSRNFQDGALYFWDGSTAAPNFVIDVPMGAPYGLYTFNNVTYFACAGSLFAWSGGQTVIKVRQLAYQNTDYLDAVDSTYINPNMFTSRYNLLMMGYPSTTTNPNINYGVWSWGSVELTFPNSYGLSYTLSNGLLNATTANNLQIGCVYNFVDSMYQSWQYTDASSVTHYGLDILDNFSSAATTATWQSLIYDGGARYKQKMAMRLKISYVSLPTGCTITPYYILDRGNPVISSISGTVGSTSVLQEINLRFHEIQYGFTVTCPAGTNIPPTITGVTIEIDAMEEETNLMPDG